MTIIVTLKYVSCQSLRLIAGLVLQYVLVNIRAFSPDLLSRPTNAQHMYIKNILYVVSTPTRFDASASSSGVLRDL